MKTTMSIVRVKAKSYTFWQDSMGDNKSAKKFNTICDVVEEVGVSFQDLWLIIQKDSEKGLDN